MPLVAVLEAAAIVVIVVAFLRHIQSIQAQAAAERSELASRIQHPERVVVSDAEPVTIPDREPDGWADIGRVRVTKDWLEAED